VDDDKTGKKHESASCTSSFTVKEPPKHPPVISCSTNPTTVKSGDPATITATASSPDERPLTYSWTTSGGRVTGTGTTVQLDTAGAPAGPITINGTATDDRGLTASCNTSVNVEVPPPPPTASKLNEIAFPDKKKPWRVDNAAKAILDDVALKLQRDADAKAVVIGSADPAETKLKKNANLAAQRAYNTKEYLVKEKGIDPSRIEIRTGGEGQKAEIWIVPAGASFTGEGTTVVDESKMAKPAAKPAKKAVKKAAPAKQ
jgi:outer membrane protein OmpA-like peptidoglycan-associated protein